MNKIIIGVVALVIGGAGGYVALDHFGLINNTPPVIPGATVVNVDPQTLATFTDGDLSSYANIADRVDVTFYGVNGQDAQSILNWYNSVNTQNGWSLVRSAQDSGNGWVGFASGWQKGATGMLVAAWSGWKVTERTGYDCVVVVATAPIWVWESLFREV